MTFLAMPDSADTVVPRSWRTRFWLLRADKWLVPAERCFTFPEAVKRNRFLVPLCVFCLGMTLISQVLNPAFGVAPYFTENRRREKRGNDAKSGSRIRMLGQSVFWPTCFPPFEDV
jgi:hypothetical protein